MWKWKYWKWNAEIVVLKNLLKINIFLQNKWSIFFILFVYYSHFRTVTERMEVAFFQGHSAKQNFAPNIWSTFYVFDSGTQSSCFYSVLEFMRIICEVVLWTSTGVIWTLYDEWGFSSSFELFRTIVNVVLKS